MCDQGSRLGEQRQEFVLERLGEIDTDDVGGSRLSLVGHQVSWISLSAAVNL